MNIDIIDPSQKTVRISELDEGDWFIRWAAPRKLGNCRVYLKLHEHSRLTHYGSRDETVPIVDISSGYINNVRPDQKVLRVRDKVEVELET